MKKIYTIIAAAMFSAAAVNAQRLIDIQTTMTTPVAGATVTSGQQITINAVVRNVGTTTFRTDDTILYGYAIDGNLISFTSGTQTFTTFFKTGKQLLPNDTMQLNRSFTLEFASTLNGSHSLCVVALPDNGSADSVKDNVTTNNSGCATVNFVGGTTSISGISASESRNVVTNVYPTPASNTANIDINLSGNASVSVKVTDLVGRTMFVANKGNMKKGAHTLNINTESLPTGIYIYQVIMNDQVSSGKLIIAK